jgi:hypothetical protein
VAAIQIDRQTDRLEKMPATRFEAPSERTEEETKKKKEHCV